MKQKPVYQAFCKEPDFPAAHMPGNFSSFRFRLQYTDKINFTEEQNIKIGIVFDANSKI